MRVTLVHASAPREVHETTVELAVGTTASEAIEAAGWHTKFPQWATLSLAVWGRRCEADQVMREGDRLELLRSLRVDPKVARRERFVGQGARSAGLFAQRRPNSKAGY
ncbi:MAG: RnfH family protein [Hydrogenophaga sp.]|uniref:RnfH family protein n=1 Tax=Hydrogenophaga sp. TaxID=1904254 RepID=UPI001D4EDEDE|nr:RnfH family protein [Hydrogenophaga sp.]MBX3611366.1 RnfH family protein [Hydrogenophaga sp.]